MRPLRYALDEAVGSLRRGWRSSLLSIGTIAIAVFVLGGVLLLTENLEQIGDEWSRSAELSVYLNDEVTAPERAVIEQTLSGEALIAAHAFVSKDDALKRFKETFSDLAVTAGTLDSNPLPASYECRLQPASEAAGALEALAARLRALPGVNDVRYDRQWLDRLLQGVRLVRTGGLILCAILGLAAALTVANVVRLSLVARRDELDIMHLVGAPGVYVRGPFVVEGVLQGGAGALAALAALGVLFLSIRGAYLTPLAASLHVSRIQFLSFGLSLALIVGGMLVGCLGGTIASRRS